METVVCIGFADALSAPEVCWSLVDAGFRVVAFARHGHFGALRYSHFVSIFEVPDPHVDVAASLSALKVQLCDLKQSHSRVVVLPLDDTSVYLCSKLDVIEGVTVAGPGESTVQVALDKKLQIKLAEDSGFNVIPTYASGNKDALGACHELFPMIAKPRLAMYEREGRLGRDGFKILGSLSEYSQLPSTSEIHKEVLVQPYLKGIGEGLFGLAIEGQAVAWSAHRRVRMMNPRGSGSSACQAIAPDAIAVECAGRFIHLASWTGLFMIEMLRDSSGKLWFMEFNGRSWGSMALARRQGFDYPSWAIRAALGGGVPTTVPAIVHPKMVCRHLGRELLHLLFVLRGPGRGYTGEWPSLIATLRELLRIKKEQAWYNWRRNDRKVFFADLLHTIRRQFVKSS